MSQRYLSVVGSNPVLAVDATAGNETVDLPVGFASGRVMTVRRTDGSGNTVTVRAVAGETLNGVTNGDITVPAREQIEFIGGDGAWSTVGFGGGEAGTASANIADGSITAAKLSSGVPAAIAADIGTELGLGDAATLDVGTGAGEVAAGDDSRITGALQSAENLADLDDAAAARTSLALGGAATLDVGTGAGQVAAGDDSRVVGAVQALVVADADNTGAVDAASLISSRITAAATFGIGAVFVPAGTYLVDSNLAAASNVRLYGAGKGKTILKAGAGVTTAVILGTSGAAVTDFTVEDLTIDMAQPTIGGTLPAIQITNGLRVHVSIHAKDCGGPGVLLQGLGSGGGTKDSLVDRCVFENTGLADGTTGHAVYVKDASTNCRITNNLITGAKGGMGVGLAGSGGTGYPTHATITGNTIRMVTSTTGFEAIGIATGCDYAVVSDNNITDSYDNGISVTANSCTVTGNVIDGTYNHGIALGGSGTAVVGNFIRNVGKQDAQAYGGVSLAGAAYCTVVGNRIVDDQGTKTMSYGVKGVSSGGNNVVGLNTISGYSVGEYTGLVSTDFTISSSANTNGFTVGILRAAQVLGPDASTALILGSSTRLTGIAYVGSSTVGSAQLNVGSNLAASRPCANFVAVFNQAADIWQSRTTASDNTTTTVVNGSTNTGRIYSNDGLTTKDVGDVTGLTSAQIDALFTAAPANGTLATGLIGSDPVMLARRAGKWNSHVMTLIA